jgi:hypothetical protein
MIRKLCGTISLVLLLGVNISSPALAAGEVSVRIANVPTEVMSGDSFTARIEISEAKDLNAAQYDITFDTTVLRLADVTDGQIDSTDFDVFGYSETGPGTWRVVHSLGLAEVSGSGFLSELHFQVIGSPGQTSSIGISDGMLSGMQGEISATWTGYSLSIVSEETDEEEASLTQTSSTTEADKEANEAESTDNYSQSSTQGEQTPVIPDDTSQDNQIDSQGAPSIPEDNPGSSSDNNETAIPQENDNTGRVAEVAGTPPESETLNWPVIGSIIAGTVVLGFITFSWLRRRFLWFY